MEQGFDAFIYDTEGYHFTIFVRLCTVQLRVEFMVLIKKI